MGRSSSLVAVLLTLLVSIPVVADTDPFDLRIEEELARHDASALPLFRQANEAREAGDAEGAIALYGEVVDRVPEFDHALRRMAMEHLGLGNRDESIALMRRALEIDRSAFNESALAVALIEYAGSDEISDADLAEASSLASSSVEKAPQEESVLRVAGYVALMGGDAELLGLAAANLEGAAPGDPVGAYFSAFAHGLRGDLSAGERELKRALSLGLDPATYEAGMAMFREARPFWRKVLGLAGWILIPWGAGLVVLLGAGMILSAAALRAATERPALGGEARHGMSSSLRRTYAAVIGGAVAYYYLSIPIVIFATLLVAGGIFLAFVALGWIPIKLTVILGIVALVSIVSMVRGLFIRMKDEDPGIRLDLAQHPELRRCLDEVAGRIDTAPVDSVFLTPGADLAVMERGRMLESNRERCLILGVGVLDGFSLGSFKAVLAHEYGHLTNRDTAGGHLALSVRNAMYKSMTHVAEGGAATWYNPAWLFLLGFERLFLRVSQGASRLQEAMADRWAAFSYGATAFEEGLRHVISRSVHFDAHVDATLREVVDGQRALTNLYAYRPESAPEEAAIAEAIEEELSRKASPYDSHPSPLERFAWVHALGTSGTEETSAGEVWQLFSDRESVELALTEAVRDNVSRNIGVNIPAAAPA